MLTLRLSALELGSSQAEHYLYKMKHDSYYIYSVITVTLISLGKLDSFTGSVMTMGVDWPMIKINFNKFCSVVYKLNLAKEKVQQGGELNC